MSSNRGSDHLGFRRAIDKDVVRRILAQHYRPESNAVGPSWLTFLGHTKDSLWSCDLFRCESASLRTYWILVVMDQLSRRIIGFSVQRGVVDGAALCRMFQRAIRGNGLPKYLSSDHDPLYQFHQWQANLRVLGVTEIKTVPYVPLSLASGAYAAAICGPAALLTALVLGRLRIDDFDPSVAVCLPRGCKEKRPEVLLVFPDLNLKLRNMLPAPKLSIADTDLDRDLCLS
jgi:hypothetical protein